MFIRIRSLPGNHTLVVMVVKVFLIIVVMVVKVFVIVGYCPQMVVWWDALSRAWTPGSSSMSRLPG